MNLPTSTPAVYLGGFARRLAAGELVHLGGGLFAFFDTEGARLQPLLRFQISDLVGAWGRVTEALIDVGDNQWKLVELLTISLGTVTVREL